MHHPLRIDPGALAHLDFSDVIEKAFGTPAEEVLLNLDIGCRAKYNRCNCDGCKPN